MSCERPTCGDVLINDPNKNFLNVFGRVSNNLFFFSKLFVLLFTNWLAIEVIRQCGATCFNLLLYMRALLDCAILNFQRVLMPSLRSYLNWISREQIFGGRDREYVYFTKHLRMYTLCGRVLFIGFCWWMRCCLIYIYRIFKLNVVVHWFYCLVADYAHTNMYRNKKNVYTNSSIQSFCLFARCVQDEITVHLVPTLGRRAHLSLWSIFDMYVLYTSYVSAK